MKSRKIFLAAFFICLLAQPIISKPAYAINFRVDQNNTRIGFNVHHMVIAWVRGRFDDFDGSFKFDPKSKEISDAKLQMTVDSIDTKHSRRDLEIKSAKFFNVRKYPNISFVQNSWKMAEDGAITVTGEITIKNVTRVITLTGELLGMVKDPHTGRKRVGFTVKAELSRSDYNLRWDEYTGTGDLVIGEQVYITLDVQGLEVDDAIKKEAETTAK